jgi:hypothetical protein
MAPPVEFKLRDPSQPIAGWTDEATAWLNLNQSVRGHPEFSPLFIKGAYVVGLIHDLC